MIQARPIISRLHSSKIEAVHYLTAPESPIDRILQKISKIELPEREHFESYMRHKWRMNHKPSTLLNSFHAVSSFLTFYSGLGKSQLRDIMRDDIEAFIEHEQDRGLKVTTARTRLNSLWAFLRFLIANRISLTSAYLNVRSNSKCLISCREPLHRVMSESFSVVLKRRVTVP